MSTPMPPEVADAVRRLDVECASWPEHVQADWRKIRGFVRARHRESQRAMPAISLAAQEVVQVRDHAQAALDAMAGVFGRGHDTDDEDTARHGKLPPVSDDGSKR
jgi:hypothetical protein